MPVHPKPAPGGPSRHAARNPHDVPRARSERSRWYRRLLATLREAVPGQPDAARTLAGTLALQLGDPTRRTPACVLLSGPLGSGTRQAAAAVVKALTAHGWGSVELELSQIRFDAEASDIDGSKPYWKGARPGRLTAAVHGRPTTVAVLHDIDRTFGGAQRSLLPAVRDGVLVDNYGLPAFGKPMLIDPAGDEPTRVDMSRCVLLFSASHGHDVWSHPDLSELMDRDGEDLNGVRGLVLHALRHDHRTRNGSEQQVLDAGLLDCLESRVVLFKPARWATLRHQAVAAVREACRACGQRLGTLVDVDAHTADALGEAFLASLGGRASFDRVTASEVETMLLSPLTRGLLDRAEGVGDDARTDTDDDNAVDTNIHTDTDDDDATPQRVRLHMSNDTMHELRELIAPHLPEPQTSLQRRRLTLKLSTTLEATGSDLGQRSGEWTLHFDRPRLVQALIAEDYVGDTSLSAAVPNVRFDDVAGQDDAKRHLREVIRLYASADALRARGVDLPRGAVLHGPPGTGKTLLAQAMAAEAGMAFIATSGTEMLSVERARLVFALARRNAPAIVFVDEADALGQRGRQSGLHDAAITFLLTAIQGFDQRAPVFILAASNRPQLLDPALTRSGRLERSILVGALDRKGREPLVDRLIALLPPAERARAEARERLLGFTHGMTGADLAQVVRTAGVQLVLAPENPLTLERALEVVMESKYGHRLDANRRQNLRERVAFHEAGHAIAHAVWLPEIAIEQVTIAARENKEGFTAFSAEDSSRIVETRCAVRRHIGSLLAGRLAEVLRYGTDEGPATGSSDDLVRARNVAFVAVVHHGLDASMGELSLARSDDEDRALMPESLKQEVFARVREWLESARKETLEMLESHWQAVQTLAAELLEHEYVPGARVMDILRGCRGA